MSLGRFGIALELRLQVLEAVTSRRKLQLQVFESRSFKGKTATSGFRSRSFWT